MRPFLGLDLPPRVAAVLLDNEIADIEALARLNARELRALRGVGPRIMDQIVDALAQAGRVLAQDRWEPYACVRGGERATDVHLATFYLCPDCRDLYADRAFSGTPAAWVGTQLVEGYCGHCNKRRSDIRAAQWLLCGVCERIVRSISRGISAHDYVAQVWEQDITPQIPQLMLREADPPELRPRGRRSEAMRDSIADFTGFSSDQPATALFGFEVKSGRKAASIIGHGVGAPMARFQLNKTDCDDILSIVNREGVPVYLVNVQVIGRTYPPTERFHGVALWWTDLWAMQACFLDLRTRSRENRPAAYYDIRMFRDVSALTEHLATGGYIQDRKRLVKEGLPQIYRLWRELDDSEKRVVLVGLMYLFIVAAVNR